MRQGQCSIRQLRKAIMGVRDEDILLVNRVGNLNIYRENKKNELEWIFIIELANMDFDKYEANLTKVE